MQKDFLGTVHHFKQFTKWSFIRQPSVPEIWEMVRKKGKSSKITMWKRLKILPLGSCHWEVADEGRGQAIHHYTELHFLDNLDYKQQGTCRIPSAKTQKLVTLKLFPVKISSTSWLWSKVKSQRPMSINIKLLRGIVPKVRDIKSNMTQSLPKGA